MSAAPGALVVDASVAVKLFLDEPEAEETRGFFERFRENPAARFVAPDLFFVECANVFWKALRRRDMTAANAEAALAVLLAMGIDAIPLSELAAKALRIATAHGVSVYDACYVAAAFDRGVPLVTADERLARAFDGTDHDVRLLGETSTLV